MTLSDRLIRTTMECAFRIAEEMDARAVMLYADVIPDEAVLDGVKCARDLILFAGGNKAARMSPRDRTILKIPDMKLTRMGQIKIAVTKGIAAGLFGRDDKVVCLTGVPEFGYFDCIIVIDVGKEFEIMTSEHFPDLFEGLNPEVFGAVLTMALELGAKGREGRPVGAIFILGDYNHVLPLTRQMIINPFAGYNEEERNILNPALTETIREFSALDGAFIIRGDGVCMAAGSYLSAVMEGKDLPSGLGSRHLAAAAVTSMTKAVAVVVSESTGTIRVFKRSKLFVSIERPVD